MVRFLFALIPALWVGAIAIIAVQNATPVSLQLFTLHSIAIPFGVWLAFAASGGMVVTAAMLLLPGNRRSARR
ncbi:MAG: hypothetical protein ACKO5P_07365 [Nodosilinea sp.]